jgi:hypothetical protein
VIEQSDGRLGRQRAIEDVSGNQERMRLSLVDELKESVENVGLILDQALPIEQPAQVPIGCVEKSNHVGIIAEASGADKRRSRALPRFSSAFCEASTLHDILNLLSGP